MTTENPNGGGTAADLTGGSPAERIDAMTADPKFRQALLAGGGTELRQLQETLTARSGSDRVDQIIAGTAQVPEIETVANGELSTSNQMTLAADLREAGIPDASIRQLLEGKPVSKAEYDAVAELKAQKLGDADFVKKWLAGDRKAKIEMLQIGIVLAGGFKAAA